MTTTHTEPLTDLADPEEETETNGLFDPDPYTLDRARIDDTPADKLKIAFGGSIELNPDDPDDRELFDHLTLGKPVELRISGHVRARTGTLTEDSEGVTTVKGSAGIKVTTLYRLTAEEL